MRRGEAASLTWEMLDRKGDTWVLRIPGSATKNGRPRELGLRGDARDIVGRRLVALMRVPGCPWIFSRRSRPTLNAPAQTGCQIKRLDRAWKSARRAAGLLDGLLVHDLRRSSARNSLAAGLDIQTAMKMSGHLTPSMFQRYAIVDAEQTAVGFDKVSEFRKAARSQIGHDRGARSS